MSVSGDCTVNGLKSQKPSRLTAKSAEVGNAVIIMAHRPSGIAECDLLMILQDGICRVSGPRDEILRTKVQNYGDISGHLDAKAKS